MRVFLETGAKRVFAGAIDWPGWARSGRSEEAALETLLAYRDRYAAVVGEMASVDRPAGLGDVEIVVRLEGGSGTDFGVPSMVAHFDRQEASEADLSRLTGLLRAAWDAFAAAADSAGGRPLASGPRGGGRSLEKIREHVVEADRAYIAQLGARALGSRATWPEVQEAFLAALDAKLRGELPERGPRGGERWPVRYATRRSAWHALDHAWEIEDRLV